MRKLLMQAVALLGALILFAACNPQPPGPVEAEAGTIIGYVVNANAGEAVDGSTVSIYEAGTSQLLGTTTTDPDGSFSFTTTANAVDLVLEKPGYAGSQVLNLRLKDDGPTHVYVIQREAFNPNWPTTPPAVTLDGVEDGRVYDAVLGFISYSVEAAPADPLETDLIYAALGKTPGAGLITGLREIFVGTNSTGAQFLDPLAYAAAGPTTFQVVVYDTNGNRTQLFRYVEVSVPFVDHVDLVAPEAQIAFAVTLGKQVDFFSVAPLAAPQGASLFVEIVWRAEADFSQFPNDAAYGYRVYRSFDGEDFEMIGTVDGSTTFFVDASPELAPGKKTFYRVTAFVGERESDPSNVVSTTPLEPFDVTLTAPADGATAVATTPTFGWSPSQEVSDYYYYYSPVLWDALTGESVRFAGGAEPFLVNRTDWTWNEDGAYTGTSWETLQRGRSYEWQLFAAYALDDPLHPTAVSVAVDRFGIFFPFGVPATDHYTFTTAP